MIYVRTCAYNAEKTLKRAIDSILQQTYQDFEYHILENGSSDGTGAIIRDYAERDKRIVPYYNKINRNFQENPDFWNLSYCIPEGDYFCILDADDFYEPTFFEEMLAFMEENHLELAACGTRFLDASSGKPVGNSLRPKNIVARDAQELGTYFTGMHWNLRQVWGKLYSSRAAAARYETEVPDWFPKAYGGDTINVMHCVSAVGHFGVYAKILHNYSTLLQSVSYRWITGREEADKILHEKAIEFLQDCCGGVSQINLLFLYSVYFYAIFNTVLVLVKSQLSMADKLINLQKILSYKVTKEMFAADTSPVDLTGATKQDMLRQTLLWLKNQAKHYTQEHAPLLTAIYSELNPDFACLISADTILWYIREVPEVLTDLAARDYWAASKTLETALAKKPARVFSAALAQTLAALLHNQDAYIFCSKRLLKAMVQEGMFDSAASELAGWEQLLPDDPEIRNLRELLERAKEKRNHKKRL